MGENVSNIDDTKINSTIPSDDDYYWCLND